MNLEVEHYKALQENLFKFQQAGLFTDVSLIVNGDEYKTHRHILACHSMYFQAMFHSNMLESDSPLIKISGVFTLGFDLLLRYMYTGRIAVTETNVSDILATAIYLQVDPVVRKCVEFFMNNMTMENLSEMIELGNIYHIESLKTKAYEMVSRQFMNQKEMVQKLGIEFIQYAVSQDEPISGREVDVLRVVLGWFQFGTRNEIQQKTVSSKEILQHIRLEEISCKSFKSILDEFFPTPCDLNQNLKANLIILYEASHSKTSSLLEITEDQRSMRGMRPAILRIGGFTALGLTNMISYSFTDKPDWYHLTTIPSMTQCNYGTAVLNNELYIVGGCFNQLMMEVVHPSSFRYNPWSNSWERIAKIAMDRCRFTLTGMNNKLYAVGGTTVDESVTNTAECYDVQSNTWKYIESLPECRQQHAAVALEYENAHLLFVSGGLLNETVIASMFMYVEQTGTWTSCAPLLVPRTDHVMFVYKNEIYVCGGWYSEPGVSIWSRWMRTQVPTIDAYNIKTNTWRHVTTIPTPRYHEDVVLHESTLYMIGGFHRWNVFNKHTEVECYDLETDTWATNVKNNQDYWEHSCVLLRIPKYAE